MLLRHCNLATFKTFCRQPAQRKDGYSNGDDKFYCCKKCSQSHWSLPHFGNKPKKFDFAHQTISCREGCVGWVTRLGVHEICTLWRLLLTSHAVWYNNWWSCTYLGLVDMHAHNANSKHRISSTFKVYLTKRSTDKAGFQCFPQFEDI